jgi:hypothetical protein
MVLVIGICCSVVISTVANKIRINLNPRRAICHATLPFVTLQFDSKSQNFLTSLYKEECFVTELETSARTESNRMTNHNTPQLSRMDLPIYCAAIPGLSRLNTRAVLLVRRSERASPHL